MGRGEAPVPLTADLCARAIIAAARAADIDPVKACTATKTSPHRLALSAAGGGINRALEIPLDRLGAVLGVARMTVYTSRSKRVARFVAAETAAMRAVEYASWRAAVSESTAGEEPGEPVGPDEAGDELGEAALDAGALAVPLERHPEIATPVKRAPAGPLTSWHGAPALSPAEAVRPDTPLGDLVLAAITDDALTSMGIASKIDRKELDVVSTLKNLEHLGLVAPEPVENGPRKFAWRRIERRENAA